MSLREKDLIFYLNKFWVQKISKKTLFRDNLLFFKDKIAYDNQRKVWKY